MDEARLLEDAREIDRVRATGAQLGPPAGLPIRFPTTAGTSFLK
jgi:hypothetical protein